MSNVGHTLFFAFIYLFIYIYIFFFFDSQFIYIINNSIYYDLNNPDPHISVVELIVMDSLLRVWEGEVLNSNSAIEISRFMITNIFNEIERIVITHLDFVLPNSGYKIGRAHV